MNTKHLVRAVIATCLLTASALAGATSVPTDFNLIGTRLSAGVGYGVNNSDLDVVFTVAALPSMFSLNASDSNQFLFGTANLREVCINDAQSGCPNGGVETNSLDVTAEFTFATPLGQTVQSVAVGGAVMGAVNDGAEDYSLVFDTVTVDFGTGGQFLIDLNDLHFFANGTQNLLATITLVGGDTPVVNAAADVPEPGSLALLGLGMLAFGAARARRRAAR